MAQWFRLYESVLDDPKVQKLPPKMFKAWINILALACRHDGEVPSTADIAFALRISEVDATDAFSFLFNSRLLDREEDGTVRPHNWASRQYKSDVSNERVKRYRKRHRNAPCNVTETPSESETEADTEQKQTQTSAPAREAARSQLLSEDWNPGEIEVAALRAELPWLVGALYESRMKDFRDWCSSSATRTFNPAATWRSFMRRTKPPPETQEDWNTRRIRLAREAIRS
jgi:hypothetical protein